MIANRYEKQESEETERNAEDLAENNTQNRRNNNKRNKKSPNNSGKKVLVSQSTLPQTNERKDKEEVSFPIPLFYRIASIITYILFSIIVVGIGYIYLYLYKDGYVEINFNIKINGNVIVNSVNGKSMNFENGTVDRLTSNDKITVNKIKSDEIIVRNINGDTSNFQIGSINKLESDKVIVNVIEGESSTFGEIKINNKA